MRRHSLSIVSSLKKDRQAGASITDLMKKYSLPKSTVWHHTRGIVLSFEQTSLLRSRQASGKRRSEEKWKQAEVEARKLLLNFKEKDIWPVLLAALYWSEGTKKSGFVFTNTDKEMVRVFLKILRTKLRVKNEDLDILVRTSGKMDAGICRTYWGKVAGVSSNVIRINYNAVQNRSKTEYGICRITLRKGGYHLKLMHCLIQGMTAKMLGRSRSSTDRTSHS